jgi:hypothetical protein
MYSLHWCRPDYTAVCMLIYTGVGLCIHWSRPVYKSGLVGRYTHDRPVCTDVGGYTTRVLARIHVSGPDSDQFTWVYAGKRGFRQVYTDVGQYYCIQGCTLVYTVVGLYTRV